MLNAKKSKVRRGITIVLPSHQANQDGDNTELIDKSHFAIHF